MSRIISNYTKDSKEKIKKKGVYRITHNKAKGYIYIGSTFCKKGFKERWYEHFRLLRSGNHFNPIFQNIINKYGLQGLNFKVIESHDDKKSTYDREVYWIDFYDKIENIRIINISKEVFAAKDRVLSEYTKNKISKSLKGRKNNNRAINLYQYDFNGKFIKKWRTSEELAKSLGMSRNSFLFKGDFKVHKKFIVFKKKLNKEEMNKIKKSNYRFSMGPKRIPITQYSKDGEFIKEWESTSDAAEFYKVSKGCITQALTGSSKTSCGYIWKYSNNKH